MNTTAATAPEVPRHRDAAFSGPAIEIRGLKKRYGSLDAVRGISFEVERGEIFGLIGADGAGENHYVPNSRRSYGGHRRHNGSFRKACA